MTMMTTVFINITDVFFCITVPQNIQAGISGNDSIIATGVFSAQELLRITRRKSRSSFYTSAAWSASVWIFWAVVI